MYYNIKYNIILHGNILIYCDWYLKTISLCILFIDFLIQESIFYISDKKKVKKVHCINNTNNIQLNICLSLLYLLNDSLFV